MTLKFSGEWVGRWRFSGELLKVNSERANNCEA